MSKFVNGSAEQDRTEEAIKASEESIQETFMLRQQSADRLEEAIEEIIESQSAFRDVIEQLRMLVDFLRFNQSASNPIDDMIFGPVREDRNGRRPL